MDRLTFAMRLEELRHKQQLINKAWEKASDNQLLELFIEIVPKALNVERCSIFVLDSKEDNVWLHCGTGVISKQIQVPKWSSMVGSVISSGEAVAEYDLDTHVGIHDTVDLQTGFTTRDALCVPIRGVSTDKITGAIQVLNKTDGQRYSEDDKTMLEKVAFNIQMAIESVFVRQESITLSEELEKRIQLFEKNLKRTFP
jgi:signal transduction protein with GAF and PtsI domain